jgi:hypothetical protein
MPPIQSAEYNPIILGFVEGDGYVDIPLRSALTAYGQLPSEYGLVPNPTHRRVRKTLNLSLGLSILALLRQGQPLPELIARFYERWDRDYQTDFGVRMGPFLSRNDPAAVAQALEENRAVLGDCLHLDIPALLDTEGLIPRATLRSIPPAELLRKAEGILAKKTRNPAHEGERAELFRALALLRARRRLAALAGEVGGDITAFGKPRLALHADAAARALWDLRESLPLTGVEVLEGARGQGLEFAYAPRDLAFLELGKTVGDCTADKTFRQVDREVENIYWTVFSWFLDRHYQILMVFSEGQLAMKVHLLPLLLLGKDGGRVILALDAIETTPAFREDTAGSDPELLEQKEGIFGRVVAEVRRLAEAMGIEHVLAERFSNTRWVREELDQFPEAYIPIGDVRKIDELEDVFGLARRICETAGEAPPSGVFMELQMKNTYLQAGVATMKGAKPFAVLAGGRGIGLPLKRVIGV